MPIWATGDRWHLCHQSSINLLLPQQTLINFTHLPNYQALWGLMHTTNISRAIK